MKKIRITMVLILIVAMISFVGCGEDEDVSSLSDSGTGTESVETEKPKENQEDLQKEEPKPKTAINDNANQYKTESKKSEDGKISLSDIPEFSGTAYVEINGNVPEISEDELTTSSYEEYGEHDYLDRCTYAKSCVGIETLPTEERGSIGMIKPTGWHTIRYESVEGKYLYNRCHLIGHQLTGEDANENNLITGTRYMNTQGMLPFEDDIAEYIDMTGNHVIYKVTPIFDGNNLLASGVKMEAKSVEDSGSGVAFNVYAYNVQPGITIDYATGESQGNEEDPGSFGGQTKNSSEKGTFVVNTNTMKIHRPDCYSVQTMSEDNKKQYKGNLESLIENGYEPCKNCLN